ncbi:MAG: 50S ribosomal protein L28 [Candidatus Omnitrophica bacterium]|nr:50S ribosomal protein L28 [Candidatus Omnitrophota bacterium]MCM8797997.1 50S ribosomal protein L28 [Candidatus Omnitrophota bacterium]
MSRRCAICGKGPRAGKTIARRGMARKKGGAGRKITGTSHRRFLPNLHWVRAVIDGTARRIRVCTECIKSGRIIKTV